MAVIWRSVAFHREHSWNNQLANLLSCNLKLFMIPIDSRLFPQHNWRPFLKYNVAAGLAHELCERLNLPERERVQICISAATVWVDDWSLSLACYSCGLRLLRTFDRSSPIAKCGGFVISFAYVMLRNEETIEHVNWHELKEGPFLSASTPILQPKANFQQ